MRYGLFCSHAQINKGSVWDSFCLFAVESALRWNVGGALAFVYLCVSGK